MNIRFVPVIAGVLLAAAALPQPASAQCKSCLDTARQLRLPTTVLGTATTPGVVVTTNFNPATFNVAFSGLPPVGFDSQNGNYLGWCPDLFAPWVSTASYRTFSTYDPALPANAQNPNWDKVNWLINNKPTGSLTVVQRVTIVQQVMWRLTSGQYSTDISWQFTGWQPLADALYNQAVAQGAGFVPSNGQVVGVLLHIDGMSSDTGVNKIQEILVEVPIPPCGAGMVGDFVWSDQNFDGLQGPTEPGINGVTVQLLQNGSVIASTVTGPAPVGYPNLPPGANGYYQFPGLCQGTYTVSINNSQPALSGYSPSPSNAGGGANPTSDSNTNPSPVTLPTNTSIDRTIDFGYYNPVAIALTCQTSTGIVGVPYSGSLVVTGGLSPFTFSVSAGAVPDGLNLNTTSGLIAGIPTTPGTFNFTGRVIDVTNLTSGTATANCSITINPRPSATCVQINAILGVAITPVQLIGTGGAGAPYSFSATGLPAGLTISPAGVISGIPTASGVFAYTVTISDKDGNTGTLNCSVTVNQRPSATCVQINAVEGVAITPVTLIGTGGAGAPFTFSATGLPTGLTISPAGVISGIPTASGVFAYTVTISDKDGNTGTLNCSVTVITRPSATCVQINAVQGVAITPVTLVGTGGAGAPYTFAAAGLPAGLTISPAGVISGIPTVSGTFNYTVTVTDKSGNVGTLNCSVTVITRPSATCVLINAIVGTAITPVQLVGTGGNGGPYTFSATGLPAGLTISPAGVISGIPTVSGVFAYTVTITDKNGVTGTVNCSVSVGTRPSATCVLINAVQGVAIAPVQLVGTGGAGGPYTFAAAGLPAGLTMSPAGVISGIPTVSGTFNYTVTVTDKNGVTGVVNCSVTVNPPPVICVPTTFSLVGNSGLSGTAGNIRTFSAANGIQVKASAFSRTKAAGAWSTAFLGAFGGGLGVTDGSEGDGGNNQHTVDNLGARTNYVLFEFSAPVIVNRAFLDSVGADSDITVWVGTKADPFNNHITLSDAVLASLGFTEVNTTTSSDSRWADINAGNVQGNVLVIAAQVDDTTPEDEFKISKIDTSCPTASVCTGSIGNFVWKDLNGNGIQDGGEPGIGGVTVQLRSGSTVVATKVTTSDGFYRFDGVCAGTYTVVIPTPPASHTASPSNVGTNRGNDSNGSPATVTLPANNSSDETIDFGYVPATAICVPSTFVMTGGSSTSGTAGNIRTFTAGGLQVKASAFSRDKSNGTWATAFLGAYSGGLGVTDGSEGDGSNDTHKVDNMGSRQNYVMFEFSQPVVVTKAFLDSVGADSDVTVWIGSKTDPFNNHLTLSDALLTSLGFVEEDTTTSSASRWAEFNGGNRSGNVVVIAAMVSDDSPEDAFKIAKLETSCPGAVVCAPDTIGLSGNTSTSGTAGNIRTFSGASGVQVKASAFSRTKSNGTWATAFLGAYSSGLGVTDGSEGDGSADRHKLDNKGDRMNYILFEFSKPVVINKALLDSIGADSDATVWIGTKTDPFNNHLTLSDSLLTGLGYSEENLTSASVTSRWADINAGNRQGNVLVIAAWVGDETAEDEFKVSKLVTQCP